MRTTMHGVLSSLFGSPESSDTLIQEHSFQSAISHGYLAIACLPETKSRRISLQEACQRFVGKALKPSEGWKYRPFIGQSLYETLFNNIQDRKLIVVARDHRLSVYDFMSIYDLGHVNLYVVVDTKGFQQIFLITIQKNKVVSLSGAQGFIADYQQAKSVQVAYGDVLVFRVDRDQG